MFSKKKLQPEVWDEASHNSLLLGIEILLDVEVNLWIVK